MAAVRPRHNSGDADPAGAAATRPVAPEPRPLAPILVVGCGPGGAGWVTDEARQAVAAAQVLVGAPRLFELFGDHPGLRVPVGADIERTLERLDGLVTQQRVAVLVTGDPGVCSLARRVVARFGLKRCRIIPGISSVQVAFARVGIEWFGATLVSAHAVEPGQTVAELARAERLGVLCGSTKTWPWVCDLIRGLAPTHRVFLCERLTLPEERVRELTAANLVEVTATAPLLGVVVLVRRELVPAEGTET
jgi:precorrin-6y C5,15-methyltransferase (decarboxylating) CbiE subunit